MTTLTREDTAVKLRLVLVRLSRTLRRDAGPTFSPSMISALASLEDLGSMRISALATIEGVDPSVTTRVVSSLEAQGLVERSHDPEDKRACLVDLSERGRSLLVELWAERTVGLNARLDRLSAKERALIVAALPALEKITRDN